MKGYVCVSMPNYIKKALQQFQHSTPSRPQYALYKWTQPAYGQKLQYAQPPDTTEKLNTKGQSHIQVVVGKFSTIAGP